MTGARTTTPTVRTSPLATSRRSSSLAVGGRSRKPESHSGWTDERGLVRTASAACSEPADPPFHPALTPRRPLGRSLPFRSPWNRTLRLSWPLVHHPSRVSPGLRPEEHNAHVD